MSLKDLKKWLRAFPLELSKCKMQKKKKIFQIFRILKEEFNFTECNFLIFLHFTRIPSAKNAKRKNEIAFEVVAYAK